MAKINAHGAHRVGPTLFTEKTRPPTYDGDVPTVYVEAWRLRSDGIVQTRIVRTRPADGHEGHTTEHSSAFRNLARLKDNGEPIAHSRLVALLERRGFTITKESWR